MGAQNLESAAAASLRTAPACVREDAEDDEVEGFSTTAHGRESLRVVELEPDIVSVPPRRRRALVTAGVLLPLCALGAGLAASAVLDRPLTDFTREPQHALGGEFYVGSVAVLAMLAWSSGAAIALFTAALASRERLEFLVLGSVTAYLVLDDALQLHETVFPRELGFPQLLVYAVYGSVFVALLGLGRGFLARHDTALFVAAVTFLGTSVLVDVMQEVGPVYSRTVEQGAKLLGIGLLVAFILSAAADALKGPMRRPERPSPARAGEGRPRERSPAASRGSGGHA